MSNGIHIRIHTAIRTTKIKSKQIWTKHPISIQPNEINRQTIGERWKWKIHFPWQPKSTSNLHYDYDTLSIYLKFTFDYHHRLRIVCTFILKTMIFLAAVRECQSDTNRNVTRSNYITFSAKSTDLYNYFTSTVAALSHSQCFRANITHKWESKWEKVQKNFDCDRKTVEQHSLRPGYVNAFALSCDDLVSFCFRCFYIRSAESCRVCAILSVFLLIASFSLHFANCVKHLAAMAECWKRVE